MPNVGSRVRNGLKRSEMMTDTKFVRRASNGRGLLRCASSHFAPPFLSGAQSLQF